ncbi:MAG: hypothetical protein AAF202_00205 [Pseudomonadota bacterium]
MKKRLGNFSICLLLIGFAFSVWAEEPNANIYQPLSVPVEKGDRFVISGFRGSVKVIAAPESRQMTIQLKHVTPKGLPESLKEANDEWLFSLKRDGGKILAQVGSPQSKSVWTQFLAKPEYMPEFHLIVRGPSMPLVLSWQSGAVDLQGWKAPVEVTLLDSVSKFSGTEGALELSQQKGKVTISNHKGPISLDTYEVSANLKSIEGDLNVQNFKGSTSVSGAEGKVAIQSYSGQFEVSKGKGQISFASERGKIAVSSYEGDLDSETDIGSVRAVLVGQSRVKIKTRQGNVSLRMPDSGANVNVGSETGYLNVPKHLRFTRLPNLRLMTGRLKGKNSGRVFVRTETGEIKLR